MIEYIFGAIVGAVLASVVFLVARLLSQQQKQFDSLRESTAQQLDTIRRETVQDRQHDEAMITAAQSLQRHLDQGSASSTATLDRVRELDKKLDGLSTQIAGASFQGGVLTGASPGRIDITRSRPRSGGLGGDFMKRFTIPDDDGLQIQDHESTTDFTIGGYSIEPNFRQLFPDLESQDIARSRSGPVAAPTAPAVPPPAPTAPAPQTTGYGGIHVGGADDLPPATGADDSAADDHRIVDLMFATNRKYSDVQERFTGERNSEITFGEAFVRIPERHLPGAMERPTSFTLFSYTLYQQKEDPKKHFVLRGAQILARERWLEVIGSSSSEDALVFVHGFNNSFEDALYRNAQIVWDLQFKGTAVLFSWPSRGAIADYAYDRESAMGARKPFIEVLEMLSGLPNVKQIHILAHSMGNMVVLDALGNYSAGRIKLGKLIMAAPDVDRDLYTAIAPAARKLTKGMTLYASAADKALLASKLLAGAIPRAGDVPAGGPIVLADIDSIDATSLGEEIFGLNHGTFASSLSILNDVLLLLKGLPLPRVVEITSMPEGVDPPKYWRYITGRG